jgi:hypothetical protein
MLKIAADAQVAAAADAVIAAAAHLKDAAAAEEKLQLKQPMFGYWKH